MARLASLALSLGLVFGCSLGGKDIGGHDDEASESESAGEAISTSDSTSDSTTDDCGPDTSGTYLLGLETSLGPDNPLQFVLTLDVMYGGDCLGVASFGLQPLSLDMGSQTSPREFVGEPLIFAAIPFDAAGQFTLDMGEVMVTGAANPITGSDIAATLVLEGHVVDVDALCGDVFGMLTSPLQADLAGSSFAAIRLADDGSDPATLPTSFPYDCDQLP
ncbi:hypothetical protein ACNOYE_10740 [Nannocystaceae bacterium ST9]